jgi:hypothetical protein
MQLQRPLGVISPTLDADVLEIMSRSEGPFTIPQIQAMCPTRSIEGIRKTLRRLVAEGIVDEGSAGRTNLYSINRDHLAFPAISSLSTMKQGFIDRLAAELSGWSNPPLYAAIFGSAARNEMGSSSDVDLFLIRPLGAPEEEWSDQLSELAGRASRWIGNDVRPLIFGEEEVAELSATEPVLQSVLRDGLPVVGQRSMLNTLLGQS